MKRRKEERKKKRRGKCVNKCMKPYFPKTLTLVTRSDYSVLTDPVPSDKVKGSFMAFV